MLLGAATQFGAVTPGHTADGTTPRLSGVLTGGAPFDLARYRGKVVMVNFWATWCPACRADFPVWQEAYEWFQDAGFEIVAVSIDRDQAVLQQFLDKHPYTIPVVWRFDPRATDSFPNISGTPTTFLIGRDGEVVSVRRGRYDLYELTQTIEALLQP